MKLQKHIEYWVEVMDEGDIDHYLYQDSNKKEALKIARELIEASGDPKIVSIERVESWGNDNEGIVRRRYQDVDINTGELIGEVTGDEILGVI